MPKIKLPVVRDRHVVFPDRPICPWCRKRKVYEPHSMAILNAGAMRQVGKDRYEMATDVQAFMTLVWHGAHTGGKGKFPEVFASVDVADQVVHGQFDLYFCSTSCLRGFLSYCVDALEQRIEAARLKKARASQVARGKATARKTA